MGSRCFVPLADVPDMFWKPRIAKQGFSRGMEGPNHFADMDQRRASDGKTLLDLTQDDDFIDPGQVERVLLVRERHPQRRPDLRHTPGPAAVSRVADFQRHGAVRQSRQSGRVVCAAGVLTHYIGDACQPLHISFLHDGDPEQPQTRTIHHRDGTDEEKSWNLSAAGVHSAYEDAMVSAHRGDILDGLAATPKVKAAELIETGFEAAKATITMMRTVFARIPPRKIVQFYIHSDAKPKQLAEDMWKEFGKGTVECMQDGTHLLAVLWQSAWTVGDGDHTIPASALKALTQKKAMKICQDEDFLPSMSIGRIGDILKEPV